MIKKPIKKVGKKSKQTITREKYYPKLKQLIESVGEWNVNYLQLQNEWGVPDTTLQRWRDKIFEEIGPIDITKIGREVCKGAESNVKMLQKMLLRAESANQKINCIRAMNDTIKTFTEMLESYKFKVKVSDKLDIGGSLPVKIIINKDVMKK